MHHIVCTSTRHHTNAVLTVACTAFFRKHDLGACDFCTPTQSNARATDGGSPMLLGDWRWAHLGDVAFLRRRIKPHARRHSHTCRLPVVQFRDATRAHPRFYSGVAHGPLGWEMGFMAHVARASDCAHRPCCMVRIDPHSVHLVPFLLIAMDRPFNYVVGALRRVAPSCIACAPIARRIRGLAPPMVIGTVP